MIKIEITWKLFTRDQEIMSAFHNIRVKLTTAIKDDETFDFFPSYMKSYRDCNYNHVSYILIDTPEDKNNFDVDANGLLKEETTNIKIVKVLYKILFDDDRIQSAIIICEPENAEGQYMLYNTYHNEENTRNKQIIIKRQ